MKIAFVIVIFLTWLVWASFSTGGLYQLQQMNPEYQYPHKSINALLSKLEYSEYNGLLDKYHVELCFIYMPNWEKTESCYDRRKLCQILSDKVKNPFGPGKHGDVFSDKFESCYERGKPFMGPAEWLRTSRIWWRLTIFKIRIWFAGGIEEILQNEEQNWRMFIFWRQWMEKGI